MSGGIVGVATPDPGTNPLIQRLANPPNPLTQAGQSVNALTAVQNYAAQRASADAYRQSVNPLTGEVDLGKYKALLSQGPGAFNFGPLVTSGGQAVGAVGVGTQNDIAAKQAQLNGIATQMGPLYDKVMQGGTVSPAEAQAAFDQAKTLGLVTPAMAANFQSQLNGIPQGGNANSIVLGVAFGTAHGQDVLKSFAPGATAFQAGGQTVVAPTNPLSTAPGNLGRGGVITHTPTADTMADVVEVKLSDGTTQQMSRRDALNAVGGEVPGKAGVTYLPPDAGGYKVVTPAQPPAASAAPAAAAPGAPAPGVTPPGRITPPTPAPTPEQPAAPPQGKPAPGGATYGRSAAPGQVATTEESAQQYRDARADQTASVNRVFTLEQAQKALTDAKTGALGQSVQAVNSVLNSVTPEFIQKNVPGADFEQRASSYDEAQKYLTQIANANAGGIGGPATNDKLAAATVASPNVHITDLAAKQLVGVLIGQERMKQYMFNQAQAQGVTPQNFADWKAKFMTTHDPRAFLPRTQSTLDYLNKNVHGPERTTLNNTMSELDKNGTIPLAAPTGQD